jgi:lantibiotic modifying enzyme
MLAGMAHGAAGIATALARLFGVTGREEYRNTAAEAYRYERSLFDHEEMNWPMLLRPDPVGDTERIFVTTWCHGAPGIALARIGGLGAISDREVRAEIDVALEITGRFGVGSLDHLCCGNMGRVDAFLTAGRRFGNLEHKRAAAMRLVKVLERYLDTGGLGLCLPGTDGPDVVHGFFQGYSGIGYQLLRFAYPDQIPSVLAFEAPEAAGSIGNPE